MKLAKERISFSLLAGGFDVPDLKPLTTSWLHSCQSAAPLLANPPIYRHSNKFTLDIFKNLFFICNILFLQNFKSNKRKKAHLRIQKTIM
jgi:hypothetical protein